MSSTESDTSDDLLWGVREIGKAIRRSDRRAYHLLARGLLPGRKVGASWVASRRKLLEALIGDDGAGVGDDGAGNE
jgi:hypothetical protein